MSRNLVVKLENVSKYYKLYSSPKDRLKEALNPFGKKYHKEFYALKDISFELNKGECLGVIGKNGMGKSTLLKIIAHVIPPSSGKISVNGNVSALLELGTGFNPEFSGRQNIYFYGTILGFSKNQIEEKIEEIIRFADIGEYIDQPVKTYSSGMFVRLAFSVQTSLEPDILIVDEVLSVGDIFFQQKCHSRIEKLLSKGTSLIIVSHDMQLIEKYSNSTLVLSNGELLYRGNPHSAIQKYYSLADSNPTASSDGVLEDNSITNLPLVEKISDKIDDWPSNEFLIDTNSPLVYGDKKIAQLTKLAVYNAKKEAVLNFKVGEKIIFFYEVNIYDDVDIPVGAVVLINRLNIPIHGKDTLQYPTSIKNVFSNIKAGSIIRFKQEFILDISPGEYTFTIAFGNVKKENLDEINKVDFDTRDHFIKWIFRAAQAGRILISPNYEDIILPFHGYVNLKSNYQMSITNPN
ncbi:MAG: ABC transporter ATP-binding protein [Melioribacter sp.]|nr:ABC transporter ATP-binding protein [Melioribacter sp.]